MMMGHGDEEESGTAAGARLSHPLLLLPTSPVSASHRCESVLLLFELSCFVGIDVLVHCKDEAFV
jgi:hypothetical protein